MNSINDTIAAISTPAGSGGIAIVRVSGPEALAIVNDAWKGTDLTLAESHTVHLGKYFTLDSNLLDEGVATIFKAPKSFTGENVVEIGVHGSTWIQREILADLVKRGARIANPGEFTQRAFLNGRLDLAQAEGVADLIAASSKAAHDMAINQTRGSFSKEFETLRNKLVEFASLLELELDFSEEDVEFADRSSLLSLLDQIIAKVDSLAASYSQGNAIKNGVPVVIAGVPNAGKSSLLNLILGDDKAIVTDIPGTTRDIIEDTVEIDGILYRFIDTAGLRETNDVVEEIGVNRALQALAKAFIVIWLLDSTAALAPQLIPLQEFQDAHPDKPLITLLNKSDLPTSEASLNGAEASLNGAEASIGAEASSLHKQSLGPDDPDTGVEASIGAEASSLQKRSLRPDDADTGAEVPIGAEASSLQKQSPEADTSHIGAEASSLQQHSLRPDYSNTGAEVSIGAEASSLQKQIPTIPFSTKTKQGLSSLLSTLKSLATAGQNPETDIIVSNARHYEALTKASQSLARTKQALITGLPADLVAQDIREAIARLGSITGSITSDTLLHSIFSRFCIGK